jgi:hypothetical protein
LISADGWPSHPFLTTMKSECQIVWSPITPRLKPEAHSDGSAGMGSLAANAIIPSV